MPIKNHWKRALTANTTKGAKKRARGMLMRGYLISSPIATHASNPAKHHQIMHTAAPKLMSADCGRKEGVCTKAGSEMFGIIVRNQMTATPQKKNMKPFCSLPAILTPQTFATIKPSVTTSASATSETGSV